MKRLVQLLAVLAVLGLAALIGLALMRDKLLAAAIEEGGTRATGVATTVESVRTGFLGGELAIEGLRLANPPTFSEATFVGLGKVALAVPLSRLSEDPLRVELVEVDGLELRLERRGTALNYEPIRARLQSLAGDPSEDPAEGPSAGAAEPETTAAEGEAVPDGPARTVVIDRVRIADWKLFLDVGQPMFGPTELSMGELVITEVEVAGDQALEKALGRILDELILAALEQAPGLPPELGPILDGLRAGLADGLQSEDLDRLLEDAVSEVRAQLDVAAGDLSEQVETLAGEELEGALDELKGQAGEEAAPLLDEAAKKLGGLFGGKSDG